MRNTLRHQLTRVMFPLATLAMLANTGCSQMAQALASLGGSGATANAGPTTPNVLGSPVLGAGTSPPNPLAPQGNPASPAASLPPPVGATQDVERLASKFGIKISGSCAQGRVLQNLEAGLSVFQAPQRFQGVVYDIPCDTQDTGGSGGEWTGEETNGPYKIIFNGAPSYELERALFIHETGHHLHLAHTNTDIKQKLESVVKTTPEYYPSAYSKPDASRGAPETITKADGTQMVMDLDQGEQIAELITYCKELANGGILRPLPDDTPNWSCPSPLAPVIQPL